MGYYIMYIMYIIYFIYYILFIWYIVYYIYYIYDIYYVYIIYTYYIYIYKLWTCGKHHQFIEIYDDHYAHWIPGDDHKMESAGLRMYSMMVPSLGCMVLGYWALGLFFFRLDRFSKKNKLGEKIARWFLIIVSPCCQTYGSDFMMTIEQRATFGNVKVIL